MIFLLLAVWEVVFGHDLLFQPARVALAAITVVLLLAIPYRNYAGACSGGGTDPWNAGPVRRRVMPSGNLPRTEKITEEGEVSTASSNPSATLNLSFCKSEVQGWRPQMEDAACVESFNKDQDGTLADWILFGMFDGHGGQAVSRRISSELADQIRLAVRGLYGHPCKTDMTPDDIGKVLMRAYEKMDAHLRSSASVPSEFDFVGSTAICTMVSRTHIVCANVGDSRALISRGGRCISLSEDHKPELPIEKKRIEAAGGSVAQIGPCYRVDGWGLNLSRAFGDFHYKQRTDLPPNQQKVCAEPDLRIEIREREKDEFLFLGCDGVFELLKNQDIIDWVQMELSKQKESFESNSKAQAVAHSDGSTGGGGSTDAVEGEGANSDAADSGGVRNESRKGKLAGGISLKPVVEGLLSQCISPNLLVTQGKGGDNVSAILVIFSDGPFGEATS